MSSSSAMSGGLAGQGGPAKMAKGTSKVEPRFSRSTETQPFNLLLFGAPGVGKGTFGKLIQKDFKFKPFSTGDYFREVIKMADSYESSEESEGGQMPVLDPFTQQISEILSSGKLVDDHIVIDIVKNLIEHPDTFLGGQYKNAKGRLILDGIPRTVK